MWGSPANQHSLRGKPFLKLSPESEGKLPSPLQKQALEILTYTFPLLHLTWSQTFFETSGLVPPTPVAPVAQPAAPAQWNQLLPRNLQAFPFRALIGPLFMLCLRTTILLYIFTPSTPILAIVMCGWIAWEIWGVVQAIVAHEAAAAANQPNAANARGAHNAGNAEPGNAAHGNPGVAGQPIGAQANGIAQGGPLVGINGVLAANSPAQVLDKLAQFNLKQEEGALFPPEADPHTMRLQQEPSLVKRLQALVVLFVLTLHPGLWLRRRTSLRQREAKVKREIHERREAERRAAEPQDGNGDGEERQADATPLPEPVLRPRWLLEYIKRVEEAEWIDG
jgi:hypothetical protein